jgi:hypothetical protein
MGKLLMSIFAHRVALIARCGLLAARENSGLAVNHQERRQELRKRPPWRLSVPNSPFA